VPEPLVVALIAAIGGIAGGLISAIARPVGQDWLARRAESREGSRAFATERKARVERVAHILAGADENGSFTATAEREWRELAIATAAVDDEALSAAVGRLHSSPRPSYAWSDAHRDPSQPDGELLSQLGR
jgi:hypothetical protein